MVDEAVKNNGYHCVLQDSYIRVNTCLLTNAAIAICVLDF